MKEFLDVVRPMFGGSMTAAQMNGCETMLAATSDLPIRHRAYILASVFHETGARMQPVREAFGTSDDDTIAKLERAWIKGQLTWVSKPYWHKDADGKAWFGRGHIQITHKTNYRRLGERLGVDLVGDPNRAMNPDLSARIAVVGMVEGLFTGKKLADYTSYRDMRRVVNGMDRADLIAGYAKTFEAAIEAMPKRKSFIAAVISLLARMVRK